MTQKDEKEKDVNQILDLADSLLAGCYDFLHEESNREESFIEMEAPDQLELFGEYRLIVCYSNDTYNQT